MGHSSAAMQKDPSGRAFLIFEGVSGVTLAGSFWTPDIGVAAQALVARLRWGGGHDWVRWVRRAGMR
jgi:hypothetical protein